MNNSRAGLTAEFNEALTNLLTNCQSRGVTMAPYFGLRTPLEQAKLWRQSRPADAVQAKIAKLKSQGADYLASLIQAVGPCKGPWATNAIPGLSWHQYGIAMDCVWMVKGREEWAGPATVDGIEGYEIYAREANKLGLTTLGSIGDFGHVQQPPGASPLAQYKITDIDRIMRDKFG